MTERPIGVSSPSNNTSALQQELAERARVLVATWPEPSPEVVTRVAALIRDVEAETA